jgi:hypothetical protein
MQLTLDDLESISGYLDDLLSASCHWDHFSNVECIKKQSEIYGLKAAIQSEISDREE